MKNNMNKAIEKHEYNLRQFIDIATRYSIDGLFNTRNPNNNISIIVAYHVENARLFFEDFRNGLKEELTKIENWKAFEIDIKDRFLPMIKTYYEWYGQNKAETKKFEPFNFYEWMFGIIESTEHEIRKYFEPQDFLTRKRAELRVKREEREKRRTIQKDEAYKLYIDNDNYSQTLIDFEEAAIIEKINLSQSAYLKYLRTQKERYGNAAYYHIQYTNSNLSDEHLKIGKFIANEIASLLDKLKNENKVAIIDDEEKLKESSENEGFVVKFLEKFRNEFNNSEDYFKAIETVSAFFLDKDITIIKPIFVRSGNIKKIAFAMGEIWRSHKNDVITYEYLQFYKQVFSIFGKQSIDKNNLFSNPLYKYSLSKT